MKKSAQKYLPANVIIPEQKQQGALVLGDCNSAIDHKVLKPNHIRLIISIGLEAQPPKNKIPEQIQHRVYDIHDNKQQKLGIQLLDQTCELIENGRQKGGVLVHCYAGVSRSSSFVIAYLINKYLMTYDDAKDKVKKRRPCIQPGDGFIHQLRSYAKVIQNREEERLAKLNQKMEVLQFKEESPAKEPKSQQVSQTERTRRGVRGGVKSAETFVPEQLRSSLLQKKLEERTAKEVKQPSKSYKGNGSKEQLRQSIDKIEGRVNELKGPSTQKIYATKTKVI